jgi:hypothetical protein
MTGFSRRSSMAFGVVSVIGTTTCALPERNTSCNEGRGTAELFADLGCNLCASRSCCAEAGACGADEGCSTLMECFAACNESGDAACFAACRAQTNDTARADDLLDCVASRCESDACVLPERAATCAEAGATADVFGRARCDLCIRRSTCEPAAACAGSPACQARLECMSRCVGPDLNPACFDQCRDDGAAAVGDALLFTEIARNCRAECSIGSELECVGNYGWPTTAEERVDVSFKAINRNNSMPFEGLEVTACGNQPLECDRVGQPETVTTNAEGVVTVNVPTRNGFEPPEAMSFSGFRGWLLWQHPESDPEVWVDTLLIQTRPYYRDRVADELAPFGSGSLLSVLFGQIAAQAPAVLLDPARGSLLGGITDCRGTFQFFAQGVALEIEGADDLTRVVFVNKSETLPDFAATATTEAGQFLVINVPTGTPLVTLRHAASGNLVAQTPVEIEPGKVTVLAAWPQPR